MTEPLDEVLEPDDDYDVADGDTEPMIDNVHDDDPFDDDDVDEEAGA